MRPDALFRSFLQKQSWVLPFLGCAICSGLLGAYFYSKVDLDQYRRAEIAHTPGLQHRALAPQSVIAWSAQGRTVFHAAVPLATIPLSALYLTGLFAFLGVTVPFRVIMAIVSRAALFYFVAYTTLGLLVVTVSPDVYALDVFNLAPTNVGFFLYRQASWLHRPLMFVDLLRFVQIFLVALGCSIALERVPLRKTAVIASLVWAGQTVLTLGSWLATPW